MAFSKGRNELQASIEDTASVLISLSEEINSFYSCKIIAIKDDIRKLQNADVEKEELDSMLFPLYQLEELYNSLYIEAMEMIVSKVYSYVEKHLYMICDRIKYDRKKVARIYERDNHTGKGSDIEKIFYVINKLYYLEKQKISDYWSDFVLFHKLRTYIEHHNNYQKQLVKIEFIISNINQAKSLLNVIEMSTNHSQVKYVKYL